MLQRVDAIAVGLGEELPHLRSAPFVVDDHAGYPRSSRPSAGRGGGGHADPVYDVVAAGDRGQANAKAAYRDAVALVDRALTDLEWAAAVVARRRPLDELPPQRELRPSARARTSTAELVQIVRGPNEEAAAA